MNFTDKEREDKVIEFHRNEFMKKYEEMNRETELEQDIKLLQFMRDVDKNPELHPEREKELDIIQQDINSRIIEINTIKTNEDINNIIENNKCIEGDIYNDITDTPTLLSFRTKLNILTIEKLRDKCKDNNIICYSKCNKPVLIELLCKKYENINEQIQKGRILPPLQKIKKVNKKTKKEINEVTIDISESEYNDKNKKSKVKKQNIPKHIRDLVWNHYIGCDIPKHRCLCCKKIIIESRNFHVGHVLSENNGGTLEIGNLRPICSSCNLSMGTENMIDFVKKYGLYIG